MIVQNSYACLTKQFNTARGNTKLRLKITGICYNIWEQLSSNKMAVTKVRENFQIILKSFSYNLEG